MLTDALKTNLSRVMVLGDKVQAWKQSAIPGSFHFSKLGQNVIKGIVFTASTENAKLFEHGVPKASCYYLRIHWLGCYFLWE